MPDSSGKHRSPDAMTFLEHLEVLRWHLVRSFLAVGVFAALAFVNKRIVFDAILLAPKQPGFVTYRVFCNISGGLGLGDAMCFDELPFSLVNIYMSGQFTLHIVVSMLAGVVLAFPYLLWELWRFIRPALHRNERRYTRGIVFYGTLLFAAGLLFGYYVIVPLSVNFLGTYQVSSMVPNQITLTSFITTVATITLATGLIFELPILVYFLTRAGLLTPAFMRKYRRHALVGILITAAVITPPDVSSQVLMAIPLILLYEVSIYVSALVVKKNKEEE